MKIFYRTVRKPWILKFNPQLDCDPFTFQINFNPILEFHTDDHYFNIVRKNETRRYLWSDIKEAILITRINPWFVYGFKYQVLFLKLLDCDLRICFASDFILRKWEYFNDKGDFLGELRKHVEIKNDYKDYTDLKIKILISSTIAGILCFIFMYWLVWRN